MKCTKLNNRLTPKALAFALILSLGLASVASQPAQAGAPVLSEVFSMVGLAAIFGLPVLLGDVTSQNKENAYALIKDDAAAYLAEGAQNPSALLQVIFDKAHEEIAKRGETQLSDQDIATILLR